MKTVVVFLWLLTITLGIDIHGIPDVISAVENVVKLDDFAAGSLHALQRKVQELDSKLGEVITQMNSLEFRIKNMLENWQEKLLLDLNINEYFDRKIFIDECYKQLKNYLKTDRYETRTILDFSNNIVSPNPNSIIFKIDSLHRYITDKNENIILKLARFLQDDKAGSRLCDIHQTSQQILYSFYKSVVLTEIKSFVLIKFAYNYKRIHGEGRFRQELLDEKQRFKNRVNTTIKIFKPFLAKASRQLRKCDPSKHVLGKTYEELTGLLQGVILNEQNLSPSGDCYQSCGSFNYVTKIQCRKHQWCQKQKRCRKVVDCKKLDTKMEVYYKSSSKRRYEYVMLRNKKKTLGVKSNDRCMRQTLDVFNQHLFWGCDYCFCICDELGDKTGPYSDRYISLVATLADIAKNRVVTGLRFVKHNRIIHLQVQEGELLPHGQIAVNTTRWVPVKNYKLTDRNVHVGQDFHVFSWEQRGFDLDDIEAEPGHVITGVRFKRVGTNINLEILQTPFNFTTGKLAENAFKKSVFRDNIKFALKNIMKQRRQVAVKDPDVPTKSSSNQPISKSYEYVQFTHSDIYKDAAQTTVPFFDIQPVESLEPAPLSGVGVFYKGRAGFGGFIALKIITYDVSRHMDSVFSGGD